ncbi:enoyl-CoA hydratase/isomerase family protein [Acuticoccus kandeliae]|uniref:enoyl-CoA hydratase/isomerase family protein n=1 Tax=Acuticoccus kandeliae TaxID=2073160 RepID=UPI000D3EC3E3|nr:enoyl-CoA hydratase/isomerase family protein [Acuticoccus kandeliae]
MSEGSVHFTRKDGIAEIVFDRVEAMNALTWSMYDRLAAIADELAEDRETRVVIFRGAGGKAFIAGTDIRGFAAFTKGADGLAYEAKMDDYVGRLERLPQATIAVVEGYAVGGGLAIAAVCDLRIATPESKFGSPLARTVGNCLSAKSYARLQDAVGTSWAKRMLILGEMMSAADAHAAGFLTDLVPADSIAAKADEMAQRLLRHAPLTIGGSKEALLRLRDANLPDIEDIVERIYGSNDFREGVRSFLAKEKPNWTGT